MTEIFIEIMKNYRPQVKMFEVRDAGNMKKNNKILYFAYGSNLNMSQMAYRCPGAQPIGCATLPNHNLVFRGVADVTPGKGSVPGAVWELEPYHLYALDKYEGFPTLYDCRYNEVVMENGERVYAMFYYMKRGGIRPPSKGYFRSILCGYRDFGMDNEPLMRAAKQAMKTKQVQMQYAQ